MQAQVALNVPGNHRWFEAVGIDAPLDDRLRPKRMAGGVPLGGGADEILIDQSVASVLPANVGDTVTLETANAAEGSAPHPMRVVGIVKRPQIEFLVKPTVYLPMATLAAYMGGEAAYNVIDVKLKAEPEDLPAYTRELTKALGPEALAAPSNSRRAQFEQETRSLNFGLILLSIVSGGCAAPSSVRRCRWGCRSGYGSSGSSAASGRRGGNWWNLWRRTRCYWPRRGWRWGLFLA